MKRNLLYALFTAVLLGTALDYAVKRWGNTREWLHGYHVPVSGPLRADDLFFEDQRGPADSFGLEIDTDLHAVCNLYETPSNWPRE